MPTRKCRRCGQPAASSRHHYCLDCQSWAAARRRRRSASRGHTVSREQRGYGLAHQRLRRAWERRIAAGGVACGYCGGEISPDDEWDLSHPGDRRDLEPVPWHRAENRRFASAVTKPRRNRERRNGAQEDPYAPSRRW